MQKIVLSQKTLGVIVDRLRKVTSGIYHFTEREDVNPLRCITWGKAFPEECTTCADVKPHWLLKSPEELTNRSPGDLGFPLIHMAFDAESATYFVEGDVFYFKGNTIIVNNTHGTNIKIRDCRNVVTKITCLKKFKDLNDHELSAIQERKDFAIESYQRNLEMMEMDMMRDFDDDIAFGDY